MSCSVMREGNQVISSGVPSAAPWLRLAMSATRRASSRVVSSPAFPGRMPSLSNACVSDGVRRVFEGAVPRLEQRLLPWLDVLVGGQEVGEAVADRGND